MKKIVYIALAAFAVATSCSKENASIEDQNTKAEIVTISATISESMTKVAFDPSYIGGKPTELALTWAEGDQIRVYNHANRSQYKDFTLAANSVGKKKGVFEGEAISAASYDVEVINGAFDYASQTQPSDGETTGLKYLASANNIADYSTINFTDFSSVLAITAKMPSTAIAAKIKSVDITASENIFNGGNNLTITLGSVGDADNDGILHFYATLPQGDQDITDGTTLTVHFNAPDTDHTVYTRYIEMDGCTFKSNNLNTININATNSASYANASTTDIGTSANPYLIGDKYQMDKIHDEIGTTKKYFKMVDDVDLDGVDWDPLNTGDFKKAIDFDGDNHTIFNLTPNKTNDYPSFVGVLNGTVKNLVFDGASITAGACTSGVLAGYIGSSSSSVTGDCSGITVKNSTIKESTKNRVGGIAGYVNKTSGSITNCHVDNVSISSTAERIGGMFGQVDVTTSITNCTSINVTVAGSINIGGLIGVGYGNVTNCSSSGSISSTNTTSNADIALGGLVGFFQGASSIISKCSSSVSINQTSNGRDLGGLVGKMCEGTIEKSYATGNVSGVQRNVGGLVGLITNTSNASAIINCYCTGNVKGNSYVGGLVGMYEKGSATIDNCYSTSKVETTQFLAGGVVGIISAADMTIRKCVAWNSEVTPAVCAAGNWSSGAFAGVAFPSCTLTSNYRKPGDWLTAYWQPGTYDHADVSSTHKLVIRVGTEEPYTYRETTATSVKSGQDGYPQFPYQGHYTAETNLSQLASTTLGWADSVWDLSGSVPTLK